MNQNSYNLSIMPNISEELQQPFSEIISSGIAVFAEANNISLSEATAFFESKLQNVTIQTFDEKNITIKSSKEEKELLFKEGLSQCRVNPDNPDEPANKTIYINNYLLEDPNQLKSTLIHEIFHTVLSDDKLTFREGHYVHNTGCMESTFENGNYTGTRGRMMHEALVARMQKSVCQREGIKFEEKGLFTSAYVEPIKRLQKFEKLIGSKISPSSTLSSLEFLHGEKLTNLVNALDSNDYSRCDEILFEIQNKRSPISRGYYKFLNFAQKTGEKIKTIFNTKKPLMLESSNEHTLQEHSIQPKKTREETFRDEISRNGALKKLPPLTASPRNPQSPQHETEIEHSDFDEH